MKPLTDYRIREGRLLGPRGGLKPAWSIETGPYHKQIAMFMTKREAQEELARLVNEAHDRERRA